MSGWAHRPKGGVSRNTARKTATLAAVSLLSGVSACAFQARASTNHDIKTHKAIKSKNPVNGHSQATHHAGTRPTPAIIATNVEGISVHAGRNDFGFNKNQHEPNSVTNISPSRLLRQNVISIFGLQNLAPNLTIQQSNGTATPNFTLRGIGMQDITNNNTQSVMTYIDGVAYPFSSMLAGQWFDIADVSVKPGPVGFEHGQADTGGEINIRTNDPTDTWKAGVVQDIASYARSRTDVFVSGPIAKNLSFRLAGQTLQGGGWQYSPSQRAHLGDADTSALRGKLKWTPDDRTVVKFTGYWVRDKSEIVNGVPAVNSLPSRPGNLVSLNASAPAGSYTLPYRQTEWSLSPDFAHLIGRSSTLKPSENNILWGFNLNVERNLGFATLQSISSYNTEHRGELVDEDATVWNTSDEYRTVSTNSFSHEFRLSGRNTQSPLQWSIGAYYNRVESRQNVFLDFSDYTPARGYLSQTKYNDNQQTFAQYAHLSYKIFRTFTLFGGINHEADDRQLLNLHTIHYATKNLCGTSSCQAATQDLGFTSVGAASNQFSGELGIQWQPVRDFQAYFKVSKGFKPSALTANNTVVQDQLIPAKPETLLAYEAGFKSDIIPNRLRLNGAAFYYDYRGQQLAAPIVLSGYGTIGKFVNIPRSEIWGIEATAEFSPFKHFVVTQNFGYERGNYRVFQSTNLPAVNAHYKATGVWTPLYTDYAGNDMGLPKLTLNGTADYTVNLPRNLQWETGMDWQYRGSQAVSVGGFGSYGYYLPSYFLLGAHMTLRPTNSRWSVTAYASNLLNRDYYPAAGSVTISQYWLPGPPRFIGARFSANL